MTDIWIFYVHILYLNWTASADGTLRVWDIEDIKQKRVIELTVEESRLTSRFIVYTILVNEDKWVACYSALHIALFDLHTGLFLKTIDLHFDDRRDFMLSE